MPNITEEELKSALANKLLFQKLIVDFDDFGVVITQHPAYGDRLIECITHDAFEFKRLITTFKSLKQLMRIIYTNTDLDFYRQTIVPYVNEETFAQESQETQDSIKQFIEQRNHLLETGKAFPDHMRLFIQQLTANPELFQQLVKKTRRLVALVKIYPQQTRALLDPILEHLEKYPRLVRNYIDIIKLFHEYSNLILFESFHINTASNSVEFQRFINTFEELRCFFDNAKMLSEPAVFTENIEPLLSSTELLEEPEDIQKDARIYIESKLQLIKAGQPLPDCTGLAIDQLTNNPPLFRRLLGNVSHLIVFLNKIGEKYAESLINHVLSDAETYRHIFKSATDLNLFISAFPRYTEALLSPVMLNQKQFDDIISNEPSLMSLINIISNLARPFPHYADLLIERLKAFSLVDFRTVISSVDPLIEIANTLKKQAEIKPCVAFLLSVPGEYRRLVRTPEQLTALVKLYPNIQILKYRTTPDVASEIEEYTQARDNASLIGQGARDPGNLFATLYDRNLFFKIVEHTIDPSKTNSVILNNVVNTALEKPVMPQL